MQLLLLSLRPITARGVSASARSTLVPQTHSTRTRTESGWAGCAACVSPAQLSDNTPARGREQAVENDESPHSWASGSQLSGSTTSTEYGSHATTGKSRKLNVTMLSVGADSACERRDSDRCDDTEECAASDLHAVDCASARRSRQTPPAIHDATPAGGLAATCACSRRCRVRRSSRRL